MEREGDYEGVVLNRVIEGLMEKKGEVKLGKQGGDNLEGQRDGMGGQEKEEMKDEF